MYPRVPSLAGESPHALSPPAQSLPYARFPWALAGISVMAHALLLAMPLQTTEIVPSTHGELAVRITVGTAGTATRTQAEKKSPHITASSPRLSQELAQEPAQKKQEQLIARSVHSAPTATAAETSPSNPEQNAHAVPLPAANGMAGPETAPAPAEVPRIHDLQLLCPQGQAPAYPVLARRHGEHGRVLLEVVVDADGRISATRIVHSSGSARLDNAARAAVSDWHCRAARRDGLPVRVVAQQSFEFLLN